MYVLPGISHSTQLPLAIIPVLHIVFKTTVRRLCSSSREIVSFGRNKNFKLYEIAAVSDFSLMRRRWDNTFRESISPSFLTLYNGVRRQCIPHTLYNLLLAYSVDSTKTLLRSHGRQVTTFSSSLLGPRSFQLKCAADIKSYVLII